MFTGFQTFVMYLPHKEKSYCPAILTEIIVSYRLHEDDDDFLTKVLFNYYSVIGNSEKKNVKL